MTEDIKLEFVGFSPDEKMRNFTSIVAERIYLSAPSDSFIKLITEKTKNVIRATCQIGSQAGSFMAEVVADTPIRAIQQIENKIQNQIDNWKNHRFEKDVSEKSCF